MDDRGEGSLDVVAGWFDRRGIIAADHFRPTIDLAWPRIVTGFSIMSKQIADLAMVGLAVGATGAAGLAFAYAYWGVAMGLGLGLAGGTVSLVSQNYGGGDFERAALAVKQSILVALVLGIPIAAAYALFAEPLIGLLGAAPESLGHGSVYLVFVAPAVVFELLNHITSRTYAGIGDTFTPMVVRASGAVVNVVLSGVLIFGFGFGVSGAAIGTTVSIVFVTAVLAWGMFGRRYSVLGMKPSPVPLTLPRPWFDRDLTRQLIEISSPLMARRVAEHLIVFPLLWIAAAFGPVIVVALEVGRRVRAIINSVNWGFSIASSTLVGQHLGAGDEDEADAYGADIIRLNVVLYLFLAALVVVSARPIANFFVTDPSAIVRTAEFVAIGAVSSVGLGIDGAATGVLRGAGDTRWPFVATLVGKYAIALPAAALGLVTPLGVAGLYAALLLETFVPGGINLWLVRSGRWKAVSRRYRPSLATRSGGQ